MMDLTSGDLPDIKEFTSRIDRLKERLAPDGPVYGHDIFPIRAVPPPTLYKYLSSDLASMVLETKRLRYSQPEVLDDPMEMGLPRSRLEALYQDYEGGPALVLDIFAEEELVVDIEKVLAAREALRQAGMILSTDVIIFQSMGFYKQYSHQLGPDALKRASVDSITPLALCLSETVKSTRMWSDYGDRHTGVAIGFNSRTSCFRRNREQPNRAGYFGPMIYGPLERERLRYLWPAEWLFLKDSVWTDQQEWRRLEYRTNASLTINQAVPIHLFDFDPKSVEQIVFGARCPNEVVERCRDIVSSWKLPNPPTFLQIHYEWGMPIELIPCDL